MVVNACIFILLSLATTHHHSSDVVSMLSLGHILISDLLVANLFMHSLSGMILLYLATPLFTPQVFLHEMGYMYVAILII